MTRRLFSFLAPGVLVCMFVLSYRVEAQNSSLQPFTATMKEVRFDAAGTERATEIYTYAMRSDGSSVKVVNREFPDGKRYPMRLVMDLSGKKRISIDPSTQSTTTYVLSAFILKKTGSDFHSCMGGKLTPRPKIAGFETAYRNITYGKDPEIKNLGEEWVAPALNCFPLKQVIYRHGEKTGPHNEIEAITVVLGEPDSALFQIPADYAERSPRQVMEIYAKKFPAEATPPLADAAEQAYRNSRPK